MKKIYLIILFFLLTASSHAQLKVGVSAPLTGDLAEYGNAIRNGFEMAVAENSSELSRTILIYEDNQYDAAKAVTAYRKLTSIDHVDIIYNWGEAPLHAVAPIAEKQKMPILAMSLDEAPAVNKKYILRSANYCKQYGQRIIDYLSQNNIHKIGIYKTEDPFFNAMFNAIHASAKRDQTVELVSNFTPEDSDFKTSILKGSQKQFDAIGVLLLSGQAGLFLKQSRQLGSTPSVIFGTDIFESRSEIEMSSGGMENSIYVNIKIPESFIRIYKKHFNSDSQVTYAYNAYIVAKRLMQISKQFGKTKPSADEIISSLTTDIAELGYRFKQDGNVGMYWEFPLVIKQVKGAFTVQLGE